MQYLFGTYFYRKALIHQVKFALIYYRFNDNRAQRCNQNVSPYDLVSHKQKILRD